MYAVPDQAGKLIVVTRTNPPAPPGRDPQTR
jgi:hypothetical protein